MKKSKKVLLLTAAAIVLIALIVGAIVLLPGLLSGKDGPDSKEHVHSYDFLENLRPVTCDTDGVDRYQCSCGLQTVQLVGATGHSLGEWSTEKQADCFHTGTMYTVCKNCGQKQTKTTPRTSHNYLTEDPEDAEQLHYTCTLCQDTFVAAGNATVDAYTQSYFGDCEPSFTFTVYCQEDEAYIYEHLYIVDSYFYNTEYEVKLPYTLRSGKNNSWTVIPEREYTQGGIYIAARSGNVFFANNGVQEMTFAIRRDESKVMELSDKVIFLQTLQNQYSGYYPYTLDFSQATDTYWLTLKSKTGLEVGDTICVGNAQSMEDIIRQDDEPDVFGKIKLMEYDREKKVYLIELEAPSLTELFTRLDVYSDDVISTEDTDMTDPEVLTAQATQILYQSEDFGTFICAAQSTTATYLSSRGLNTRMSSFKDFFDAIEISADRSELPHWTEDGFLAGKVILDGSVEIPVTLSSDPDSQQVGQIKIYFEAYVNLDSLKVILNLEKQQVQIKDASEIVKMQVGAQQQVTAGFTFGAELELEWSMGATPYVLNTKSGKYHFKSCKHVDAVKDTSYLQKLSAEELFVMLAQEQVAVENECKTCLPISSMMADNYVLNLDSHTIHLYNCTHVKQATKAQLQISQLPYGNLLALGYGDCKDCNPSSRHTNSFSEQVLNKMKYEDLSDSMEQFQELADALSKDDGAKELEIARIPFTITGMDTIELRLAVYFDFSLEATMEYNYKIQLNSDYGIYLTQEGFNPYTYSTPTQKANEITITGKARVDVGLTAGINATIKGIEKHCFADLSARLGLYAKIQGALKHDFLNKKNDYAAAYFEAGVHCDLVFNAKLAKLETLNRSFLPDELKDIPFLSYGYEKVYYNFDSMPDVIRVDTIYYNLENADLMNVKYYDVVNMKEGTDRLSITGIKGKYSVEFRLKNGKNCVVDSGYLLINTPNEAFTDELTVVVKGSDSWGTYRRGNSKYDMESYSIRIEYDPNFNQAEIPSEAAEYENHRYYLYRLEGVTSVEAAKVHCQSVGGYLCTVTSEAEAVFIDGYLKDAGSLSQIIFGLSYDEKTGEWTWSNGESLIYTDWTDEEPKVGQQVTLCVSDDGYGWGPGDLGYAAEEGLLVLCEWGAYDSNMDMTVEERYDSITGYYQGWYTAPQGITGGALGIHRTNVLLEDQDALQMYADLASNCSMDAQGQVTVTFTVDDIKNIIEKHEGEYIAIYMFGPLRQNPSVEDGLYTMSIDYDEGKECFKLKGKEWIQHDTYLFVDLPNLKLSGNNLLGDVYGQYVELFWTEYGDVGDISLVRYTPSFETE